METLASVTESLGFWNWWILAGVLLLVELLTGTFFFLWLGAAALAVGIIMLFADWSWQVQAAVFAAIALVLLAVSRIFVRRGKDQSQPFLNRRAERHVGKVFTLREAIVDGRGRVQIDDTMWRVTGPDLAVNARVRVTGVEGTSLVVEEA